MASITIISGSPGTGKTTVARALASHVPAGLHLDSDVFYTFPAHPIDPTKPESQHQNIVIMKALARSAEVFAQGRYEVFLDGVIGPWFLPTVRSEISPSIEVEYVVLRASLEDALRRVQGRGGSARREVVIQMHKSFANLGEYEDHAIETSGLTPEAVVETVVAGREWGRFLLRV